MTGWELNYHHLAYFWAVAHDGNLSRTARRLRISQSALSSQIKQLELQIGRALFARVGRTLQTTEAGKIALSFADTIFGAGEELVATLQGGRRQEEFLRIGSVSTLSRNFQESFIRPLLRQANVRVQLMSGGLDELLNRLGAHALDVVLSNRATRSAPDGSRLLCQQIAKQGVSLVGKPRPDNFTFPDHLHDVAMILPSQSSEIRTAFDDLCAKRHIKVKIFAEVDDMAMMRLLARNTEAIALLPSVVVRDELQSGVLQEYSVVPDLFEHFFAISLERQYPHPLLASLLSRDEAEMLFL